MRSTPTNLDVDSIRTLDDLRAFVHTVLCERENILADQFGLREVQIVRGGQPCGMEFRLQGPRSIRLGAIWNSDHNTLYFYDTRGDRFLKLQLTQRFAKAA